MNVRDKPEYVCQKCKERFKISTKMVQHYAKEHKDSDLERTKEDLLLYSSDELAQTMSSGQPWVLLNYNLCRANHSSY